MSDPITAAQVAAWMRSFAALVEEQRDYLTELDAAIGDADHGANMHRGMQAVVAKLDQQAGQSEPASPSGSRPGAESGAGIGDLLKTIGMTLVSTVGGAAGPLYGTLFLRMSTAAGHSQELTITEWAAAFGAGVAGVQARGKAEPGDKTMIDALMPATEALSAAGGSASSAADHAADAIRRAADAAREGMEATTPLVARKGRASYLGERSAGHQDPGATSSWLLVQAMSALVAAPGIPHSPASGLHDTPP